MDRRSQPSTLELRPLRILFTIHHNQDENSGAAGVTLGLADEFRRLGHTVDVLSLDDLRLGRGTSWDRLTFPMLVAHRVTPLISGNLVDVVDSSTGDSWALRRSTLQRSDSILVTRSHGLEHTGHQLRKSWWRTGQVDLSWKYWLFRGGLHLLQIRRSLRIADRSFFLNEYDRRYAVDSLGVPGRSAQIVRNGVSAKILDRPLGEDRVSATAAYAFIGSFDFRKGADVLVGAAKLLLGADPTARLSLLGTGMAADEVVAAFDPAIRSRVDVRPVYERRHLPDLLAGHQVLLFPSREEGLPGAVLEAMACGLVPVASDIPGPYDIISGTDGGILVAVGDPQAMADAAAGLVTDRNQLSRRRRAAWSVAQEYAWPTIAARQVEAYRSALAEKRFAHSGRPPLLEARD